MIDQTKLAKYDHDVGSILIIKYINSSQSIKEETH
jgi:quinolinate synthase